MYVVFVKFPKFELTMFIYAINAMQWRTNIYQPNHMYLCLFP